MRTLVAGIAVCTCLLHASSVLAQNWSFDARAVGLGGVGETGNVAVNMVNEQRPYRAIVLPFGLVQILPHMRTMNPAENDFDLVRTIEYAASPIHYIFGRDSSDTGQQFVTDIRNGELSRDLNSYRGVSLPGSVSAEGLASPRWGGTFKLSQQPNGSFHGIYVGAGPYFSIKTDATIDPALASLLASETPVYLRDSNFGLANNTETQLALAVTGGYRARMAWPSAPAGNSTDGLYFGANYHFLKGFHYENFDLGARLDTDNAGLLTVNPVAAPLVVNRFTGSSGRGFAIDVGVAAVKDRWEIGFGVNGIANRIEWADVERTDYFLSSLVDGGDFNDGPAVLGPASRVELPVDVRANAAYNADAFTVIAEFANGFNGTTFRGGYEHKFNRVQLRGGGRYVEERFEPTGGVGFNLSNHVGMDVAAFATSANLERKRNMAIAFSIRLTRQQN